MRNTNSTSRRLRLAILLPAVAVGAATGCQTLDALLESAPKPDARIVGASLEDLSLESVTLGFDVEVTNPYAVALPLTDLGYRLSSQGRQLVAGAADVAGTIPARDSRVLRVPVQVRIPETLAILQGVRPGSVVPWEAELDLSLTPPGGSPLTLPLRRSGEMPLPTVPRVELVNVGWDRLTLDEASARMTLRVTNLNAFPVDLSALGLSLALADHSIATTMVEGGTAFAAGGAQEITVPLTISPRQLGFAAFSMLGGSGASYDLRGRMSLATPYGDIDTPYESRGQTTFSR